MIKIIRVPLVKSGSYAYQGSQVEKAFLDFETQLNDSNIKEILDISFNENDSEVILVAVVRIDVPSVGKPKKGGK